MIDRLSRAVQIPVSMRCARPARVGKGWRPRLFLTAKYLSLYQTVVYDNMGKIGEDDRWNAQATFNEFLQKEFPQV